MPIRCGLFLSKVGIFWLCFERRFWRRFPDLQTVAFPEGKRARRRGSPGGGTGDCAENCALLEMPLKCRWYTIEIPQEYGRNVSGMRACKKGCKRRKRRCGRMNVCGRINVLQVHEELRTSLQTAKVRWRFFGRCGAICVLAPQGGSFYARFYMIYAAYARPAFTRARFVARNGGGFFYVFAFHVGGVRARIVPDLYRDTRGKLRQIRVRKGARLKGRQPDFFRKYSHI